MKQTLHRSCGEDGAEGRRTNKNADNSSFRPTTLPVDETGVLKKRHAESCPYLKKGPSLRQWRRQE